MNISEIAKKHLNIPTLETRSSDSLDFHEVSVWNIKEALTVAFREGQHHQENKSC